MKNENAPTAPLPETDLTHQVLIALRQITQAIDLHSRQLVKHCSLTGPQLVILQEISKHSGAEVSIGEVARAISLSQSTVTGILTRLENRNLVRRVRSRTDKRRVLVQATEAGRHLLENAPPLLQDQFITAYNSLDRWEQLMILSSLLRLVALMNAEALEAAALLATGPLSNPDGSGQPS